jgi:hypothetical protein
VPIEDLEKSPLAAAVARTMEAPVGAAGPERDG